jgi:hypothetical protein
MEVLRRVAVQQAAPHQLREELQYYCKAAAVEQDKKEVLVQ